MPKQLAEAPELPEEAIPVWEAFCALSQYRGNNGVSENPISPSVVRDWCWLEGIRLEPWEREAIRRLDQSYLNRKKPK